jgi:hypothetical protein
MKFAALCVLIVSMSGFPQKPAIGTFLKNPFDLQQFKKIKRGSNSGVSRSEKYHFNPDTKGRYFYFFLFPAPGAFVYSVKGDKQERTRSGSGFQIVTFKPDGKYKDAYLDPTETLIEVVAVYNDPDLPELAFVGLDTVMVKEKLGAPFIRTNGCFIYSHENNALILNVSSGVVKCLKYIRMNTKITGVKIPKGLTEMKCSSQPLR